MEILIHKKVTHAVPRLLIVDDELEHAEICAALLRRRGYKVLVAINGTDAVELAQTLQPDLVLLDLHMPTVDGFSTAADLHGRPDTHDVPIVFLSASGEDLRARAAQVGVVECLEKPFRAADLVACVERSLRRGPRANLTPLTSVPDKAAQ